MPVSLLLSMAAFALAASISPGPVNIVAVSSGARFGLAPSLRLVLGATVGFVLLLLITGFGLHEVLERYPQLIDGVRWAGVAFLVYLAWKLAADKGELNTAEAQRPPTFRQGAAMQWLSPKAWLAAVAGMGAFAADGSGRLIWAFAAIYFVICYLSVACWAYAGAFLGGYLRSPARIRIFNRCMGALLAACAVSLLYL